MESILVVDDSKTQLFTISLLLKKEGYVVHSENNPVEARVRIEKECFDLVLCDLQMPELTGIDLLRISKVMSPTTPFIIMTAYGDRESAIEALSIGADDYIFKASGKREEEEFFIRIRRAIEKARLHSQLLSYQNDLEKMVAERTRELTEAQEQLVQSEKLRSLGVMTNGIAHDFNNILGVILGRTQLMMRRSHDPQFINDLRIIEKSALKGSLTIRRMQDYTRLRKDESFGPVDINAVIDEVVDMTRIRWEDEANERGLTIAMNRELSRVPFVAGNASELKDVFINIIFNAVEAMPRGGAITIRTYHENEGKDQWVVAEIADTGYGIRPDIQDRIFEPFFTTKNDQGSGLGMSVAFGIVQRHRGHIHFKSGETGTTFYVRLPMALFVHSDPVEPANAEPDGHPIVKRRRIMVIDDDEGIRAMLMEILQIDDHDVVSAGSGKEALELLERQPVEIVFTDLGMPEMSGWDLSQEIKKRYPDIRIIMITGWGMQLDTTKAEESGIEKIIPKPVTCDEILRTVRQGE